MFVVLVCLAHSIILSQEWHPDFYSVERNGQTRQMIHALKELPKLELHGDERVLDVGCGNGQITHYIAQHFLTKGSIHGIDNAHAMIDKAIHTYKHDNLSFACKSLFDNSTELYDAVVCFWVLYLFEDYQSALESVMKNLKPGGKALICHNIYPGPPFLQLYKKYYPLQVPLTLPTLDKIMSAVKNTHVSIEYLEVKYNYDRYNNLDEFLETMKKVPFFKMLHMEAEAQFYQELQIAYSPDAKGFIYDYSLVICLVLKKL